MCEMKEKSYSDFPSFFCSDRDSQEPMRMEISSSDTPEQLKNVSFKPLHFHNWHIFLRASWRLFSMSVLQNHQISFLFSSEILVNSGNLVKHFAPLVIHHTAVQWEGLGQFCPSHPGWAGKHLPTNWALSPVRPGKMKCSFLWNWASDTATKALNVAPTISKGLITSINYSRPRCAISKQLTVYFETATPANCPQISGVC